jgi:hypothetical protein
MDLWKFDHDLGQPRLVQGEPWPGYDSDGEQCFENTHFPLEKDCWEKALRNAHAWVTTVGRDILRYKALLREAEGEAGKATAEYHSLIKKLRKLPFGEELLGEGRI